METTSVRQHVTKAVFPAAGLGTRFLPATKAIPKEMLPIVDKPLIQYAVEEVFLSGIRDVCIVTGRGKTTIEDHFDVSFELEQLLQERGQSGLLQSLRMISETVDVSYIRQRKALGLGHAVLKARGHVGQEPFAVVLPDDLIESQVPCTKQLLDVFDKFQMAVVALMEVPRQSVGSYGIVESVSMGDDGDGLVRVVDLVEKPSPADAPSTLAVVGRYILTPEIFPVLETTRAGHGHEIQLTDALRTVAQNGRLLGCRFSGKRYDAGDKLGYLVANVELALGREEFGADLAARLAGILRTYMDSFASSLR